MGCPACGGAVPIFLCTAGPEGPLGAEGTGLAIWAGGLDCGLLAEGEGALICRGELNSFLCGGGVLGGPWC